MEGSGECVDSNYSAYNNDSSYSCYPMFFIDPSERCSVAERLSSSPYSLDNVSTIANILNGTNKSMTYVLSNIIQDVTDKNSEKTHFYDSAALLLIMFLLFLTVITIWVFKVRRFRVLHESGLALIYGKMVKFIEMQNCLLIVCFGNFASAVCKFRY